MSFHAGNSYWNNTDSTGNSNARRKDNTLNTIRAADGAEIYETKIHEIADQYLLDTLTEEEQETPRIDSTLFSGMIHRIYVMIFKPTPANEAIYREHQYQNIRQGSILDYDDITTLDKLFDIYADLCAKYRMCPSLLGYGNMIGLSKDTINDWIVGRTRKSSEHCQTAKRWKSVCEAALADRAIMSNSIGSIFALKAAHGWRETAPIGAEEIVSSGAQSTPEQIAAKYRDTPKPELPQFDDD